jgi:hypothetical protein
MPPAAPPLAAEGPLIAPVLPASVPAPPLLSARLQPAAPIVNIAIAAITTTFLKFDFIANSPGWFAAAAVCTPWREPCDGSNGTPAFQLIPLMASRHPSAVPGERGAVVLAPDNAQSRPLLRNKHAHRCIALVGFHARNSALHNLQPQCKNALAFVLLQ